MLIPVSPVGKPRMTQRDRWAKRPTVVRYFAYCDALRLWRDMAKFVYPEEGLSITFYLKMPDSWSRKKKEKLNLSPHKSRPDISNLLKAFEDALCTDDSYIWSYGNLKKVWATEGSICVKH